MQGGGRTSPSLLMWHHGGGTSQKQGLIVSPALGHTEAEPTAQTSTVVWGPNLPSYPLTQWHDVTVLTLSERESKQTLGLQRAPLGTEMGASYRGPRYKTHCSSLCIFSRALSIPIGMSWSSPSPTTNTTSLQSNSLPPQQPSRWTEGKETGQSQAALQHGLATEWPTVWQHHFPSCPQTHEVSSRSFAHLVWKFKTKSIFSGLG